MIKPRRCRRMLTFCQEDGKQDMTQLRASQCVYADVPGGKTRLIVEEYCHGWIFGAVDPRTKQLMDKASVSSLEEGKKQAEHWAIGGGFMASQNVLVWKPWP